MDGMDAITALNDRPTSIILWYIFYSMLCSTSEFLRLNGTTWS